MSGSLFGEVLCIYRLWLLEVAPFCGSLFAIWAGIDGGLCHNYTEVVFLFV